VPVPPSVVEVLRTRLARLPGAPGRCWSWLPLAGREVTLDLLRAAGEPAEDALAALDAATAAASSARARRRGAGGSPTPSCRRCSPTTCPRCAARSCTPGWVPRWSSGSRQPRRRRPGRAAGPPLRRGRADHRHRTGAALVDRRRPGGPRPAGRRRGGAHTRRALRLLDPSAPDAPRTRHDLLTALGNDLLRSGQRTEAHEVVGEALALARELGDRRCMLESAAVWGR
jgi:hypothetical protein